MRTNLLLISLFVLLGGYLLYIIRDNVKLRIQVYSLQTETIILNKRRIALEEEAVKSSALRKELSDKYNKTLAKLRQRPVVNQCSQVLIDPEVNDQLISITAKIKGTQ